MLLFRLLSRLFGSCNWKEDRYVLQRLRAIVSIGMLGDCSTSVRLLQFVRSTPGVTAPLIGQKSESHVTENMNIMKIPPLSELEFNELLKKMINRN